MEQSDCRFEVKKKKKKFIKELKKKKKVIKYLIENKAEINEIIKYEDHPKNLKNKFPSSPFPIHLSIAKCNLKTFSLFLIHKADINVCDSEENNVEDLCKIFSKFDFLKLVEQFKQNGSVYSFSTHHLYPLSFRRNVFIVFVCLKLKKIFFSRALFCNIFNKYF